MPTMKPIGPNTDYRPVQSTGKKPALRTCISNPRGLTIQEAQFHIFVLVSGTYMYTSSDLDDHNRSQLVWSAGGLVSSAR